GTPPWTSVPEPTPRRPAPRARPAPVSDDFTAGRDGAHRPAPRKRTWRPASEIAVDLGTANTLVLVKGEGVVLNEPSVAAVDQAGNIMGIGHEAKMMLGRTPDGITAVRPMKD